VAEQLLDVLGVCAAREQEGGAGVAEVVIADVSDERGEALAREVGGGSLYVPPGDLSGWLG
jgi:hypothetical protein